jgi:hypothetical protein
MACRHEGRRERREPRAIAPTHNITVMIGRQLFSTGCGNACRRPTPGNGTHETPNPLGVVGRNAPALRGFHEVLQDFEPELLKAVAERLSHKEGEM